MNYLAAHTKITIHILRSIVSILVDSPSASGTDEITFNIQNLPSGIYYLLIHAGDFQMLKMNAVTQTCIPDTTC